jgi:type IV secretory pathway VirB4 component
MPPKSQPDAKPSQEFVAVKKIHDGVLYLKKGGICRVLIVSGINFDLKSEAEQNMILSSFQNFLNTLDFSVQFFIHSRKVNIEEYMEKMKERKEQETNELLKIQIEEYMNFIQSFVDQNDIVTKSFFIVVPYESVHVVNQARGVLSLFKKSAPQSTETIAQEDIQQLNHRVDQVTLGLEQIGLRVAPLEDDELLELFYNLYNPRLVEKKGLELSHKEK